MNPFGSEPADTLFGLPMPMVRAFGLVGEAIVKDRARVRMPACPGHANSRGDVHGGALAVLFDCALASAARAHDLGAFGVVTIDISLHCVAPSRGAITASAVCERRTAAATPEYTSAVESDFIPMHAGFSPLATDLICEHYYDLIANINALFPL